MADSFAINSTYKEDVLDLLRRFSQFGATSEGGVNRLAASKEDKAARDFLCQWFEQNGFATSIDRVGNIFGILELDASQSETSLFCGSHLDSQPHGGRFDGTLGVASACIAALATRQLTERGELRSRFGNFVVACWTSEEGARFQPSLLGSRVFAGAMSADEALACRDADGVSLKQALTDIGYLGSDSPPVANHYLEVHIEQGGKLEEAGYPVGIVASSWGTRKLNLSIRGRADHTGPTPMEDRRDALLAAAMVIQEVREISRQSEHPFHSSVGRIEITPNSPNTVADRAGLWIEFRAADEALMDAAEERLREVSERTESQTGCCISLLNREVRPVVSFDASSNSQISAALKQADIQHLQMTTIAGHDALQLQSVCPSTLMFVPSQGGVSHTPEEFTSDADIGRGFEAMMASIAVLLAPPSTSAREAVDA